MSASGRIINLSQPGVVLPPLLALDTNIIISGLISTFAPAPANPRQQLAINRARQLFQMLRSQQVLGVITPTVLNETIFYLLKVKLEGEIPALRGQLQTRFPRIQIYRWEHVYKLQPSLLAGYGPDLTQVVQLLIGWDLFIVQPSDLGYIPGGHQLEEELVRLIQRYQLATNDTYMLIEASQVNVFSIASLDGDILRAQPDFDVYAWI